MKTEKRTEEKQTEPGAYWKTASGKKVQAAQAKFREKSTARLRQIEAELKPVLELLSEREKLLEEMKELDNHLTNEPRSVAEMEATVRALGVTKALNELLSCSLLDAFPPKHPLAA